MFPWEVSGIYTMFYWWHLPIHYGNSVTWIAGISLLNSFLCSTEKLRKSRPGKWHIISRNIFPHTIMPNLFNQSNLEYLFCHNILAGKLPLLLKTPFPAVLIKPADKQFKEWDMEVAMEMHVTAPLSVITAFWKPSLRVTYLNIKLLLSSVVNNQIFTWGKKVEEFLFAHSLHKVLHFWTAFCWWSSQGAGQENLTSTSALPVWRNGITYTDRKKPHPFICCAY